MNNTNLKIMESTDDFNDALKNSENTPILILKHSNTCPISARAYKKITKGIEDGSLKIDVYILIVQKSRELSNFIAEKFDIQHESPQAIMVYQNEAIWNASHDNIEVDTINDEVAGVV